MEVDTCIVHSFRACFGTDEDYAEVLESVSQERRSSGVD